MIAIDFVARTRTGSVSTGSVGGEGQGFLIDASGGNQVSLNLHETDVAGYQRQGSDLLVTLADGRTIVLEGYFSAGTPAQLFLSSDGVLHEATFVDAGSGTLYAQYGDTETWGNKKTAKC